LLNERDAQQVVHFRGKEKRGLSVAERSSKRILVGSRKAGSVKTTTVELPSGNYGKKGGVREDELRGKTRKRPLFMERDCDNLQARKGNFAAERKVKRSGVEHINLPKQRALVERDDF